MKIKRVVRIVLDGFGISASPDTKEYNDEEANTSTYIYQFIPDFNLPNLTKLRLYKLITDCKSQVTQSDIIDCYNKIAELSKAKNTTRGQWKIARLVLETSFFVYPNGSPKKLTEEFEHTIKRKTLGDFLSSATKILKILVEKHIKTGYPIVYTSADSVFQATAYEEVIPSEELYRYCKIIRKLLSNLVFEKHKVAKVIAKHLIRYK